MKISTLTMMRGLKSTRRIAEFLEKYKEEMLDSTVPVFLNEMLVSQGIPLSEIAKNSGLGDYIYKIFKGIRRASRNNLIAIASAMQLSLDETQRLLRINQSALLDPRRRKDAIVIYALEKKLSPIELNLLIFELGEDSL